MVSFLVFCLLFWVSGAASGTQDPNSEQDPGTPLLLESFVMEKEGVETLSVPPLPVLRFAQFGNLVTPSLQGEDGLPLLVL